MDREFSDELTALNVEVMDGPAGAMEGLLGLDCSEATCPHCGQVNTLSDLGEALTYICEHCGKSVPL